MGGSHGLHAMGWQGSLGKAVIGDVGHGLGGSTESGRRVGPLHGQGQRDSNELGLTIIVGHHDG